MDGAVEDVPTKIKVDFTGLASYRRQPMFEQVMHSRALASG
jgi:hypothetical protein